MTQIRQVFVENFSIEEADIALDAKLYEDLDIDSIDAVDLMVALKKKTGRKLDPEVFKGLRTVDDVVGAVHNLLAQ